jgi:hypothetical protein
MKISQILTKEKLNSLPTHRLKAYLTTVNKCRGMQNWDYLIQKSKNNPNDELTKDNPLWTRLHAMVKQILDTRENLK